MTPVRLSLSLTATILRTMSARERRSCSRALVATWPVLAESFYLLRRQLQREPLWEFIARGGIEIVDLSRAELARMRFLMDQYADLPMDFADASLVVLAERLKLRRVFTLDRRDFRVYRPRHLRSFEMLP